MLLVGGYCVDLVLVSLVVDFAVWCCGCVLWLFVVFMVVGSLVGCFELVWLVLDAWCYCVVLGLC